MSPSRLWWLLAGASVVAACESGVDAEPEPNPVPVLQATEPSVVVATGPSTPVQVVGLGFVEGAVASWGGEPRVTALLDPTRVVVELSAADLVTPGAVPLNVTNPEPGGGLSAPLAVTVGNARPALSTLSPTSAEAVLTESLTLSLTGTGFAVGSPGALARWDGHALQTTVHGPTSLSATVPDYLLRTGRSALVTVENPAPGGGVSAPLTFGTVNPVPILTALEPAGLRVGLGGSLTLRGAGFVDGARVRYGLLTLIPSSVTGTTLVVSAPSSWSIRGDTIEVTVQNREPGGGFSNEVRFPIWERSPQLDSLSRRWVYAGSPGFTLTLSGSDFAPDASVLWGGVPHASTFVDSTRIDVTVDAGEIASPVTLGFVVANPRNGGPSGSRPFSVLPPFVLPDAVVLTEVWGGYEAFVISRLDGSEARSFPQPDGFFRADPSPDGTEAVFWRTFTEGFQRVDRLHVVDLATGDERRLLPPEVGDLLNYEAWPRFSGDGQSIYFEARERDTGRWTIWRVRRDGMEATSLGDQIGLDHQSMPGAANHDDRIALSSNEGLYVFDAATGLLTRVLLPDVPPRYEAAQAYHPRWSPTDDRIAILGEAGELYIVRPDGTDFDRPQPEAHFGPMFDWLPNGEQIIGTTPDGIAVLLTIDVGKIDTIPALGRIGSVQWVSDP